MALVLIIEDNPANLALMEYLLKAFGHDVRTATGALAGVERATEMPPDVVLVDLHMPGPDGFEAARLIRAHERTAAVPLVAVTASAMVGDRDMILARGFDGYIGKPITPETFVEQVERFLRPASGDTA
ncbi:MAG: response regulator [Vicinamibacterales bacterium]